MDTVRIATLNLWGRFADWPERLRVLMEDWPQIDADIVLLQEATLTPLGDQAAETANALGYRYRAHCLAEMKEGHGEGVAILSKFPFISMRDLALPESVPARRLLMAQVEIDEARVNVVTGHTVPEPGEVLDRQLGKLLDHEDEALIIGGDFNATPDRLHELLNASGLVDISDGAPTWPVSEPHFRAGWEEKTGRQPWFDTSPRKLDYLLSRGITARDYRTHPIGDSVRGYASDHALLWGDFQLSSGV